MKSLVAQPKKQRENNRTLEYLHFWASPQARKSSSVALKLTLIELWLLYFQSLIKKKEFEWREGKCWVKSGLMYVLGSTKSGGWSYAQFSMTIRYFTNQFGCVKVWVVTDMTEVRGDRGIGDSTCDDVNSDQQWRLWGIRYLGDLFTERIV